MPVAILARTSGEGPIGRYFGAAGGDASAVEGIVDKPCAIPIRRTGCAKRARPATIAFWRSVGRLEARAL